MEKLLINGEWIETEESYELFSPYSSELIAEIPVCSEKEVDLAIQSAYDTKESWSETPSYKRAEILENLAELYDLNLEKAAKLISLESAKPIKLARNEVERTIQTFKFSAEEAKRISGETIPLDAAPGGVNRIAYTVKEPLGVIGAITPFNFPLNLVAHKIGPAIAAGNTIVLKPAVQTPLSSLFMASLLEEAGLPNGVLNIVTGSGSVVGEAIVQDKRVNMITFTGSPKVGTEIKEKAGLKKVALELGSNAAVIVDKDVEVSDALIEKCVNGAYSNNGQICISLQRIFVHENISKEFINKFQTYTEKLIIGDPLDDNTDISAMISKHELQEKLKWVEESKKSGAEIKMGGNAINNGMAPTIILNVNSKEKVFCEEVFAPIAIINEIKDVDEGISNVNDSKYGLQAGIFTNDVHTAIKAIDNIYAGSVLINDIPTFRVDHMPYGGVKQSGLGREGVKYSVEEMTEMKLVIWNKNKI